MTIKYALLLRVMWPLSCHESQQKALETGRECLSAAQTLLLGNSNIYPQRHVHRPAFKNRCKYTHSNKCFCSGPVLQLNISKNSSNSPSRLMSLTHDYASIFFILFFLLLPLPLSSAGYADGAVWRNPLSRHFSFPLTDRPWRAWAFGPPAWLAARQLNKLSSCYNSLKHFQLPQSNKSCRQALGCFSTSNPTSQRVLLHPTFGLSGDPQCYNKEKGFF